MASSNYKKIRGILNGVMLKRNERLQLVGLIEVDKDKICCVALAPGGHIVDYLVYKKSTMQELRSLKICEQF